MESSVLRNAIDRRPIRPFRLVINSGDKILVPHPEFISFSPNSKSVIVWDAANAPVWLDLDSISAIDFRRSASKRGGKKRP
jgi:hypothetical protein